MCIIYDNDMVKMLSISEQLKRRRQELGLTLPTLARRAGTSAATLSRYENGWTRFEVYTLRKLAVALECDLQVELRPQTRQSKPTPDLKDAAKRLARLFWDHTLTPADLNPISIWVLERVLDYGNLEDIRLLQSLLGRGPFLKCVAQANRVSPRTAGFWKMILEKEGIPCTRKHSRNTAWNS